MITLTHTNTKSERDGLVRAWSSCGNFIISCVLLMSVWQKLKDGNELVRFKFLVFEDHKLLFFRIYIGKNIVDVNFFLIIPLSGA